MQRSFGPYWFSVLLAILEIQADELELELNWEVAKYCIQLIESFNFFVISTFETLKFGQEKC